MLAPDDSGVPAAAADHDAGALPPMAAPAPDTSPPSSWTKVKLTQYCADRDIYIGFDTTGVARPCSS